LLRGDRPAGGSTVERATAFIESTSLQRRPWIRYLSAVMSRVSRPATLNPEPSYRDWRVTAVKALQKLNPLALAATREGLLTRCYVQGLSPQHAAELAAREYDSTHPPSWLKRQR